MKSATISKQFSNNWSFVYVTQNNVQLVSIKKREKVNCVDDSLKMKLSGFPQTHHAHMYKCESPDRFFCRTICWRKGLKDYQHLQFRFLWNLKNQFVVVPSRFICLTPERSFEFTKQLKKEKKHEKREIHEMCAILKEFLTHDHFTFDSLPRFFSLLSQFTRLKYFRGRGNFEKSILRERWKNACKVTIYVFKLLSPDFDVAAISW